MYEEAYTTVPLGAFVGAFCRHRDASPARNPSGPSAVRCGIPPNPARIPVVCRAPAAPRDRNLHSQKKYTNQPCRREFTEKIHQSDFTTSYRSSSLPRYVPKVFLHCLSAALSRLDSVAGVENLSAPLREEILQRLCEPLNAERPDRNTRKWMGPIWNLCAGSRPRLRTGMRII